MEVKRQCHWLLSDWYVPRSIHKVGTTLFGVIQKVSTLRDFVLSAEQVF